MSELDQIMADIQSSKAAHAAKLNWNPETRGEIDIRIAADGRWFHEGRQFKRDSLVNLFAGILRREDQEYFLVTPVEKLRITVDDAPFIAGLVESIDHHGEPAIVFTTNIGERILVDREHPIRIEINPATGEPRPYVLFRDGLEALISRSAFFDLLNMATETKQDGISYLSVSSMGATFELGSSDE